jgi:hypothetical protein
MLIYREWEDAAGFHALMLLFLLKVVIRLVYPYRKESALTQHTIYSVTQLLFQEFEESALTQHTIYSVTQLLFQEFAECNFSLSQKLGWEWKSPYSESVYKTIHTRYFISYFKTKYSLSTIEILSFILLSSAPIFLHILPSYYLRPKRNDVSWFKICPKRITFYLIWHVCMCM